MKRLFLIALVLMSAVSSGVFVTRAQNGGCDGFVPSPDNLCSSTVEVSGGLFQLVVVATTADRIRLGSESELTQTFSRALDAQNHFLRLLGRMYGVNLAPIPEG